MKPSAVENSPAKGLGVDPSRCISAVAPVADATYNGTGYTGLAGQSVNETPTPTARVIQAVVAFTEFSQAEFFYNGQMTLWKDCENTDVTVNYTNDKSDHVHVGTMTETEQIGNVLITPSAAATNRHNQCQRAMTVRNNVVIDVRVCSPNLHDGAVALARNIAGRVAR